MPSNSALDLERALNPEQAAAVTHGDGPQLVLAGAGSGKTRVITYRVAWLVQERHVDPSQIVAMTFTNKAAGEMRDRVQDLLGLHPLPTFVGTFHRFALGLLRRHGKHVGVDPSFAIFDSSDQLSLVKKALAEENLSESAFPPRSMLGTISAAKNRLLDPETYAAAAENFYEKQAAKVYRQYQRLLIQSSGVDFDDMLRLAVKLLTTEEGIRDRLRQRIRYLLVDEFQDTNHAQMRMVQEIVAEAGNLTAVGDEDQGIYRWRGADLDNVLNFEQAFPGAVVRALEQNYRSTQNILDTAGDLVAHNQRRRGKRLWTEAGEGSKVELYRARDDQDEARWILNTFEGLRGQIPLQRNGNPGADQRPDPSFRGRAAEATDSLRAGRWCAFLRARRDQGCRGLSASPAQPERQLLIDPDSEPTSEGYRQGDTRHADPDVGGAWELAVGDAPTRRAGEPASSKRQGAGSIP